MAELAFVEEKMVFKAASFFPGISSDNQSCVTPRRLSSAVSLVAGQKCF
jgi:hypothetical protein